MDVILMGGRPKDSQLSRYHVKSIFLTQPRLGGTFIHSTRIHLGSAPSRMYPNEKVHFIGCLHSENYKM